MVAGRKKATDKSHKKKSETSNNVISGGASSKLSDFLNSSLRSKVLMVAIITIVATAGAYFLFKSFATTPLSTSTSPNDVIVQYSLPHAMMPRSSTNLATPQYSPFTLYGNGLLICGHDTTDPFAPQTMAGMNMVADAKTYQLPTSTTLTQDQIATLISQINATGFFQLNKEYYQYPLAEAQDILRVSVASGDHYVLYYNDVAAPAAYTATLNILQNYCQQATTPYQSSTVILRSIQAADPKAHGVAAASTITAASGSINQALTAAAASHGKKATAGVTVPGEADLTVSSSDAQALTNQFAKNAHQFVQQNGITYELGLDEQPPTVNNPLNINYTAIRAKQVSLVTKIKNFFVPKTEAQNVTPVRVVILQAADQGPIPYLLQAEVQEKASAIYNWYCGQIGECFSLQGVTVIQGSKTEAQYMTCPAGNTNCPGDPMMAVIYNAAQDPSLYNSSVDTEIITGWSTNEVNVGYCGYGFVGAPLAVTDLQEPKAGCAYGEDMAHELGHTFGLIHTGNGTLMDGPPNSQYAASCDIDDPSWPTCRLDATQASQLRTNALGTNYFYTSSATLPAGDGYWTVASDGGVFTAGTQFYGSAGGIALAQPVTSMTPTPDSGGYFLSAADGGIFAYGDAQYAGSANQYGHTGAVIAIAARADNSYWQLDQSGEIFAFNAPYYGGGNQYQHNGNFVGMAVTNDGGGYWLVDSTGQIFAFGDAGYYGAPSGQTAIVGIAATKSGGYVEVNNGGGTFTYGTNYYGSIPGLGIGASDVVGIAGLTDGGYVITRSSGSSYWFSSNGTNNVTTVSPLNKPLVGVAGLRNPSSAAPVAPPGVNPQYEPVSIPTGLAATNSSNRLIPLTWIFNGGSSPAAAESETGMNYCTELNKPAEAYLWQYNDYLCSNNNYNLYWTSTDSIPAGYTCNNWQPLTGTQNMLTWLCWPNTEDNILGNGNMYSSTNTGGNLFFSTNGNPNPSLYKCVSVVEPNNPNWVQSSELCQNYGTTGTVSSAPLNNIVRLSWNASTDSASGYSVSGYLIYRNNVLIAQTYGSDLSYADPNVKPSTTYNYQIAAYALSGPGNRNSQTTATVSITTPTPPDLTPPSTPTGLSANATAYNNVNLSWTASTDNVGVTGYYIVRNGVTIAQTSGTSASYSDKSVSPSTSYSYQVIATDAAGNNSSPSNTVSVTTPKAPDTTPPSAPANLVGVAVSTSQINLSWSASTDNIGVAGYNIYRNGTKIASATSTSYGDTGLSASTSYQYYVKAYDASNNLSTASTTITVQTQSPAPAPGAIKGLVTSSAGSKPIQGATVSYVFNGTSNTAITSSTGNYTFSSAPAGSYSLSCIAPGFRNQSVTVKVSSGITTTQNFVLLNSSKKK